MDYGGGREVKEGKGKRGEEKREREKLPLQKTANPTEIDCWREGRRSTNGFSLKGTGYLGDDRPSQQICIP